MVTEFQFMENGHIIDFQESDTGKFLTIGDLVILQKQYFKVCSKTCDVYNGKWIIVLDNIYIIPNGD